MSRKKTMWAKAAFGLAALCLCLLGWSRDSRAVVFNGWDYSVPDRIMSIYDVHVLSYDAQGRVASYSTTRGVGSLVYSNAHYNSSGQLVYSIQSTIAPSGSSYIFTATQLGASSECPIEQAKAQFKTSQQVVSANILRTERRAVEGTLFDRLRLIMLPGHFGKPAKASSEIPSGVASGDAAGGRGVAWSLWLDGALTSSGTSRSGLQNAGFNTIGLLGVEGAFSDRLLFGLAMGYSNMTTTYYNGSGANQTDNGFILNPYLGYMPVDNLLIAVQGGLILANTTVSGNQTVLGVPINHDANYGVVTAAIGTDVSYAIVCDRLVITPHAGYSYSSRQPQGGNVKGVEQGILSAGAMVGYNFAKLTPYLSASYNYDTIGQTRALREDMLGTIGLTYQPTERLQTSLAVSNTFFRDREYETTFDLNVRYTF